jgi:hypothetical protein
MSTNVLPADPWGGGCTTCGAALSADQRYCLACGTRRDGSRLPFRDALSGDALPAQTSHAPATVLAAAPAAGAGAAPLLTTLAALGCVLLAFGVGVLVGDRDGGGGPVVVPAAAQAAAPVAAAAPPTTTAEDAATTADAEAKKDDAAAADDGAEESATPAKPKKAPKKLVEESKSAIANLEKAKTPEQYAEQSAKLPDVVVTGGGK